MSTDSAATAAPGPARGADPNPPSGALRRMVRRAPPTRRAPADDDGLRQAAPRAVDRVAGLSVALGAHGIDTLSRDDLGAALPEGALVFRLSPGEGSEPPPGLRTPGPDGLAWLGADLFAALVERRVTGALRSGPPEPRRPTPLDAVICGELIDMLCEAPGVADGMGMRRAGHLPAPDLAVALADIPFRVMRLALSLRHGGPPGEGRGGEIGLALPDPPPPPVIARAPGAARPNLLGCAIELRASLPPLVLTWERIVRLVPGEAIELPPGALDAVRLDALDGAAVAGGRLGRMGEARAVRLRADPKRPTGSDEAAGALARPEPEVAPG